MPWSLFWPTTLAGAAAQGRARGTRHAARGTGGAGPSLVRACKRRALQAAHAAGGDSNNPAARACAQEAYFRLMVVFTPWPEVVLSSNQRAVTVLVCV